MFVTIYACKKTDIIGQENETAIIEKLFPVNKTADEDLKIIMQQALKENSTKHFAAAFASQHGYVNWVKAEKIVSSKGTAVIAPFAFEQGKTTNGLLVALLKPNQNVTFKFVYRQQLKTQPSGDIQSLLDYFDHKQFNSNKINYVSADQVPQRLKEKFPGGNILNNIKPKYRIVQNNATSRTECITYVQIIDYCYVPSGEYCDCDESSEYYEFSVPQTHQYCYTTFDEWIAPADWGSGYGGGWDAQTQLAYELNNVLLPGHSYAFQYINPNNSLNFSSVTDFQNFLIERDASTTLQTEPFGITSNGNDTIVSVKVNRSLSGGEKINIKLSKDSVTNNFSINNVTSSDYGITLGWDYDQDSYSVNTNGNEITVDVYGYENYFAAIKSLGILYKLPMHFRIKINKLTGAIISSEKI